MLTSGGGISPDSTRLRKSSTDVFLGMKGGGEGAAADDDEVPGVPPVGRVSLLDPPTPPAAAARTSARGNWVNFRRESQRNMANIVIISNVTEKRVHVGVIVMVASPPSLPLSNTGGGH